MITYKVFIQIFLALQLSDNASINQHLCSALRENKNYFDMIRQCSIAQQSDCMAVYKNKCEDL